MARNPTRPAKGGHANDGERPEKRPRAPRAPGPLATGPGSDRLRTFVEAYLANGGNAGAAAATAGHKGKPASLHSQGSRLLARARAAGLLDERLAEVRKAIGADEVLADLNDLRLALREGIGHFMTFPTPLEAQAMVDHIAAACTCPKDDGLPCQCVSSQRAAYLVNVLEGRGWLLDIERGVKAGYAGLLSEVETTHDSAGMPRVKVKLHSRLQAILGLGKLLGLGDGAGASDDARATVIRERTLLVLANPATAAQLDGIAAQAFAGKRIVRGQVVDAEATRV